MNVDGNTDNLATLPQITSQTITSTLTSRYTSRKIYTRIGDILIALNPFEDLDLYSDRAISEYSTHPDIYSLPPHIYSISQDSFNSLKNKGHNQCCVISGESGSGKTETAKLLMRFLSHSCETLVPDLPEQCHNMNPLIEAFGNAKTVINGNSSRFGKYVELQFTPLGELVGAKITEYLLEKSRVISHADGEQNFHIFYYLYAGLTPEYLSKLKLEILSTHRYLVSNSVDSVILNDVNNQKMWRDKFQEIVHCFSTLGFSKELLFQMLSVLITILYIGDIEFGADEEDFAYIANPSLLVKVAGILGVATRKLQYVLTTIVNTIKGGEIICKRCTVEKASALRDATAKAIYSRLFSWIIAQINASLGKDHWSGRVISVLDIFGFENFKSNYFEQLCIDTANEQLQFYFNQHIFAWEVDEYKSESIPLENIEFVNNKHICDLLLKRPGGIFSLLDEESVFPRANDQTFLEKIKAHCKNSEGILKFSRANNLSFTISHFAGDVEYSCQDILEKNRDTLSDNIVQLLEACEHYLIRELFSKSYLTRIGNLQIKSKYLNCPKRSHSVKKTWGRSANRTHSIRRPIKKNTSKVGGSLVISGPPPTVGSMFRNSLCDLMEKMLSCNPHFIRCIKPNQRNFPRQVEQDFIERQLRSTGVLETVRIRQSGYSFRPEFAAFLRSYGHLIFPFTTNPQASKENCSTVLTKLGIEDWMIGGTKVFLKYYHSAQLDKMKENQLMSIIAAQRIARRYLARQTIRRMKTNALSEEVRVRELCQQIEREGDQVMTQLNRVCSKDTQAFISLTFRSISTLDTPDVSPVITPADSPELVTPFSFPPGPHISDLLHKLTPEHAESSTRFDISTVPEAGEERFSEYFEAENLPFKLRACNSLELPFTPVINKKRLSKRSVSRSISKTSFEEDIQITAKRSLSESDSFPQKQIQPECNTTILNQPTPHPYTRENGDIRNWLRIVCSVEPVNKVSEFLISQPSIIINGNKNTFESTTLSLGTILNPEKEEASYFGKGIEIFRDKSGDVHCKRLSKNPIKLLNFEDKSFYSKKLSALRGVLPLNELVKLTDFKKCCEFVDEACKSGVVVFTPVDTIWGLKLQFQLHKNETMIPSVEIHFLEPIDYYEKHYMKRPVESIGSFTTDGSIGDESQAIEGTNTREDASIWVDIYRTHNRKHKRSVRRRNVIESSVFMSENTDTDNIISQIEMEKSIPIPPEKNTSPQVETKLPVFRRNKASKRAAINTQSQDVDQLLRHTDSILIANQDNSNTRPKSTELEIIAPSIPDTLEPVCEMTSASTNLPEIQISNEERKTSKETRHHPTDLPSGKITYTSVRRRNREAERKRVYDSNFSRVTPSRDENSPIHLLAQPNVQQHYSHFHEGNVTAAELHSAKIIQLHEAFLEQANEFSRMKLKIFSSGLPKQKIDQSPQNLGMLTRKKWHKPMTENVVGNRPILSRATKRVNKKK